MRDWREGGKLVEEAMIADLIAARKGFAKSFDWKDLGFLGAVVSWAGRARNSAPLIEWLRSDRPITPYDREQLAEWIEIVTLEPPKGKRGRPRNRDFRSAVLTAQSVYTPSPAEAEFDGLTAGLGTIQLCP